MHNPNDFLYPQTTANKIAVGLGLTAAPTGIKLLDISENQSREIVKYFPQLIADGYGGIIVRATDGMLKDKSFDYFYPAILDAGLTIQVYGAMYASRNGTDQAKFLADTVSGLLSEVDGNLVAWNDGETSDGVPIQTHRVELLRWLAEASKVFRKVGAYGSLKTWQEIYGNLTLPSQFYFWNAQWRSGTVYTLPAGITQAQLVFWQNGVWPKYAWGEQPDNLPESEDVDLNVMPGKTMKDLREFTEQDEIPPTPVPVTFSLPTAKYVPIEESLAYRVKSFNAKDNEVFDFYPTGSADDVGKRIHITSPIDVFIEPTYTGDGAFKCYHIVDTAFLAKYKPTCPIYADATKGHLQVP